ncbi:MAG: PilN domain-containing protein [Pseudomonadota bacterium]
MRNPDLKFLLRKAWAWWLFEISGCIPGRRHRLHRIWDGARLGGTGPLRRRETICLAQELVLTRRIRLPIAAFPALEQVLAARVAADWPLEGRSPAWSYAIDSDARGEGRLEVSLYMADPDTLEQARRLAERTSADIGVLDGRHPARLARSFSTDIRTHTAIPIRHGIVAVTTAMLAVAALHLWQLDTQRTEMAQARVLAERQATPAMAARRHLIARQDAIGSFLRDQNDRHPMALSIATISRALPDTAWLTRLSLTEGEAQLSGRSQDAAKALLALEAASEIEGARFASPILRDTRQDTDRFEIALQIAVRQAQQ